jgi:23S rRNA pseudouridine1911/1915/1917 synthase
MAVVKENSKKAVTEFNVIKRYNNFTYLEADLKTGRTHQIRVHFAHLGFPIIGDKKYGSETEMFTLEHQLLHAYQLGFYHPTSNQWVEYKAELPKRFQQILAKIKDL